VKIRRVTANSRKRAFDLTVGRTRYTFPYAKAAPLPTPSDPVRTVVVDDELSREAFSYVLVSGRRGTVHVEQVLEYSQDPAWLREQMLYDLTLEAQRRLAASRLAKREVIRRLGTSASQFYRLLDQTNYRKSIAQLLVLLHVRDCDVRVVVRKKTA